MWPLPPFDHAWQQRTGDPQRRAQIERQHGVGFRHAQVDEWFDRGDRARIVDQDVDVEAVKRLGHGAVVEQIDGQGMTAGSRQRGFATLRTAAPVPRHPALRRPATLRPRRRRRATHRSPVPFDIRGIATLRAPFPYALSARDPDRKPESSRRTTAVLSSIRHASMIPLPLTGALQGNRREGARGVGSRHQTAEQSRLLLPPGSPRASRPGSDFRSLPRARERGHLCRNRRPI